MGKTEFHGNVDVVVQAETANVYAEVVINKNSHHPKDPCNPNLVDCPDCSNLVSWRSNQCPTCGLNVFGHFAAMHHAKQQKRLERVALFFVGVAGLGYLFTEVFPQVFGVFGFLMIPFGLFFAMAALNLASKKP